MHMFLNKLASTGISVAFLLADLNLLIWHILFKVVTVLPLNLVFFLQIGERGIDEATDTEPIWYIKIFSRRMEAWHVDNDTDALGHSFDGSLRVSGCDVDAH